LIEANRCRRAGFVHRARAAAGEVRGIFEFNASLMLSPLLMARAEGRRSSGPDAAASRQDLSMADAEYLKELGYDTYAWKWAATSVAVSRMRAALRIGSPRFMALRPQGQHRRVEPRRRLCARSGTAGADMVRYVVTLESPFGERRERTNATRLYEALTGKRLRTPELRAAISGDLPVPTTSIYSRADGIVNWRTCLLRLRSAENMRYTRQSCRTGASTRALWAVGDWSGQTTRGGEFKQFDRIGAVCHLHMR